MKRTINRTIPALFLLLITLPLVAQDGANKNKATDIRTIIVFFDGLRPDYITPEGMPNLYAFRQQECITANNITAYSQL